MGFRKGGGGKEMLAVDWMGRDVVVAGGRDGGVRCWDVRSRMKEGTSCPVVHPSVVAHVRRFDENKIVVAGLENQLCSYDLRYLRSRSAATGRQTKPFLTFPAYRNKDRNGVAVGFDIYRDLIAAGTDDGRVQIFDGGTGKEVDVGVVGALGKRKLKGLARCLKFVGGEETGEGVRLLVSSAGGIEEWAW